MSLYRKYRPKDFVSLIGQEHIKTTLLNAIKSGKVSHAYLFTGPRGTGKTTTARLLAKAINAETVNADGTFAPSELLEEIDQGRVIDIIEIDAASNRGIDEMRDLREKVNFSPTRAKCKVYIIDEVHMLTKEAFNALLKTLEEPPEFVYFILATTEVNKVPETIISRCQRFDFRRISLNDMIGRLKEIAAAEKVEAEEEALTMIAKQARGGLRDALGLMEQVIKDGKISKSEVEKVLGRPQFMMVEELVSLMEKGATDGAVRKISEIHERGFDLTIFNKDILEYLRQEMLKEVEKGNRKRIQWLVEALDLFQQSYEKLRFSYIAELPLELATIKSAMLASTDNNNPPSEREQKKNLEQKIEAQKVPAEKVETVEPENNNQGTQGITMGWVMGIWPEVIERIHHPIIKRTVQNGRLMRIEGDQLILAFASAFHRDKMDETEHRVFLENHLEKELKNRFRVRTEINPGLIIEKAPGLTGAASKFNNAESLAEMFDGEVVD